MPPKKGGNVKKESGRAKKAENKARKKEEAAAAAVRRHLPASNESQRNAKSLHAWFVGKEGSCRLGRRRKTKKQRDVDRDAKKAADATRKAEAARQLAEEGAALSGSKPKGTGQKGAAAKQKAKAKDADAPEIDNTKEEYAATGLDDALEMMGLANTKMDKASVGQAAASIESHPERRFKAALEVYKERTLPELKDERPGLRLRQYNDIMYKQFQKHPDNPFNQLTVAYNATQEERVGVLQRQKERTENRYRQQS